MLVGIRHENGSTNIIDVAEITDHLEAIALVKEHFPNSVALALIQGGKHAQA